MDTVTADTIALRRSRASFSIDILSQDFGPCFHSRILIWYPKPSTEKKNDFANVLHLHDFRNLSRIG